MATAPPCAQPPERSLKQNGDMSQGKAITGHPCVSPREKREMYDYLSIPGSEVNVPLPTSQALGLLAQIPPSSRLTNSLQPPLSVSGLGREPGGQWQPSQTGKSPAAVTVPSTGPSWLPRDRCSSGLAQGNTTISWLLVLVTW